MGANINEKNLDILRQRVEETFAHKIKTPKDFDSLSQAVLEVTKKYVSATTLKRMWGYLSEPVSPRKSTLDVLSRYSGYDGWEAFLKDTADVAEEEPQHTDNDGSDTTQQPTAAEETPANNKRRRRNAFIITLLVILAAIVACALLYDNRISRPTAKANDSIEAPIVGRKVLRLGDTFNTYDDYLQLFGIDADDRPWAQPLPNHPDICIWGPEYHNRQWHNDGNPDSLMPTIKEYWYVADANPETVRLRNTDHYTYLRYRKELRVTFMKGLCDSTFTFLGLYCMDREQSDTTSIVWRRIADECDLTQLDYLEQLRQ